MKFFYNQWNLLIIDIIVIFIVIIIVISIVLLLFFTIRPLLVSATTILKPVGNKIFTCDQADGRKW